MNQEKAMSGRKILCVESEPENLAILTYMLEGMGYEVLTATNSWQAIAVLGKQTMDGVLLDHNLPNASGAELRRQLKMIQPDIPVLLFEGVGSQTPFMVRFFDSYLRNGERHADGVGEFES
jgi:CheY-like chemotaxis protein